MKSKIIQQVVMGLVIYAGSTSIHAISAHGFDCAHCSYQAPGGVVMEDFVTGPTAPGKWGSPVFGTGATVTWSLMGGGISVAGDAATPTVGLDTFMPVGYQLQLSLAFAAWSAVADLTFIQITDTGEAFNAAGASGDIRIGAHAFDGPGGTLAHGFYPPNNGTTAAGDIHFDSAELWKIGFGGGGFDIFQVAAHEIGHAIGLNHTGVANSLMNPNYTESFAGLQADDIAGAQFIYGVAQPPLPPVEVPEGGSLLIMFGSVAFGVNLFRRKS